MKTLVKLLTVSVFFLLSFGSIKAQVYPVLANVYLIPPYGSYLSDYYTSSREKLVVTLLNRDQQEPVLEAYLRMTVTSSTGLRIQNRPEINYPSITLDAGIPVRLSQEDLAPYFLPQNIVQQGYLNQGKLPNGMIEFTFQAVEKYTGKILSAPSTGRIWLTTQKPPLLVFPNRDENIPFGEPFNLKFQWQAQHNNISQVEYEFELRELPNSGAAPQSAFLYSPVIHQERLFYTSLIYSAVFPPLDAGKTYGWRVRAIAKDGVDELNIFENNGYSEIFWFHTNSGCEPPAVNANVHDYQLDLTWNAIENISEYEVQFCNKYEGTGEWRKYLTDRTNYTFYSLQLGSTYQYRVGAKCANGNFVYGNVYELTMPEVDTARMANCGIIEDIDLSNREPLPELKAGDVFMASDYPVTVTKVTGSNGVFTGEGWVMLRWILNVRVAVEFENIPINTDKRATGGIINFKYNKDWKNVGNLDNYSDGGRQNTASGIIRPDYTFNFVIPENPVFVYDTTGYLIVYDYSTTPPTEAGRQKLNDDGNPVFPMTVKDKEGNVYRLTEETDENGNKIISSEYLGKQGTPLTADNFDADRIDSDKAIVSFEKGAGKYAFDKFDVKFSGSVRIRDKYTKIGDYNVPWKFLPEGGSDKIQAKIITVDNAINPADVMFQTPQGMLYEKKHLEGNTFEISAVAGVDNDVQQIYALYPTDDGKFLNLGRIDVVTYKPQTQKIVAVSVNGNTVNTNELHSYLNGVYGEVGVTFEIETDTFTYNNTISFFEENSGWFSRYTSAMKSFNISYRERIGASYDKDKNYLFILGEDASRSDRDAQGFMPLGGRFGYLFVDKISGEQMNSIAAHELGHGIWALKHTFDNDYGNIAVNTTDNLMDYTPEATHLAKWQWEIIRYPALFTDPFGGDEEGMGNAYGIYVKNYIKDIRCLRYNDNFNYNNNSFKYNNGEYKYDSWANPLLFDNINYGAIWVWYTCSDNENIDISKIKRQGSYVYVGDDNGCQLKFLVKKDYADSPEYAQNFLDYLTISKSGYKAQFYNLIVKMSNESYDNIIRQLLDMPSCMHEMLTASWRFFFFEKIINQDNVISEQEAICLDILLSTEKDSNEAEQLLLNIKSNQYEYKLIKNISNINSVAFDHIANGLSKLYYTQNKENILTQGENIDATNMYVWRPLGNVYDNYQQWINNPSLSTLYNYFYKSTTYYYTTFAENNGNFRIHATGTAFGPLGTKYYHHDFYINPLETVSVYFASKNKYINIENYTVVMPGILLAWIINKQDNEINQIMRNIGLTAATFYLSGSSIINALGSSGKILRTIIFAKELTDKLLESPTVLNILIKDENENDYGYKFIQLYRDISGLIDCGIFFKDFASVEINDKLPWLIDAWERIDESRKNELKINNSTVYYFIQEQIEKLKDNGSN